MKKKVSETKKLVMILNIDGDWKYIENVQFIWYLAKNI